MGVKETVLKLTNIMDDIEYGWVDANYNKHYVDFESFVLAFKNVVGSFAIVAACKKHENTLFIAISNIHWTITMAVLFVTMWVGIYLFMPIAVVMPALYQLLKSIAIEHVFKKYMSPEDLALEEERNRNFYN